jgi:hypothetical protein
MSVSPTDARQIAKEAYIYGFPMAANYRTMYTQVIDHQQGVSSRETLSSMAPGNT